MRMSFGRRLLGLDFHADIEGGRGMGDGADGDAIDAGEGDWPEGFQRDAAGGFQDALFLFAGAVAKFDGGQHLRAIHVVQQDDEIRLRASAPRGAVPGSRLRFRPSDRASSARLRAMALGQMSGELFYGNPGDVVVLDQQAVEQAEAMIVSPAAADGVFVEDAESRDRFAGVVNFRVGALDALDEPLGLRGHAAEMLEEVEDDPLGRKQRPHRPANAKQRQRTGVAEAAFENIQVKAGNRLDAQPLVIDPADHLDQRQVRR